MNENIGKMQDWWQKREGREKKAIQIAVVFILLFAVYELIWSPIYTHVEAMRAQIINDSKTLAWMRAANESIQKFAQQKSDSTASPVSILSNLEDRLVTHNLNQYASAPKQSSSDVFEIHFQNVDFDQLITFLIDATKTNPIIVAQLSVVSTDNIGQVNADLQLRLI